MLAAARGGGSVKKRQGGVEARSVHLLPGTGERVCQCCDGQSTEHGPLHPGPMPGGPHHTSGTARLCPDSRRCSWSVAQGRGD